MSTQRNRKRIDRLQEKIGPEDGFRFRGTLEEFCRLMWHQDPELARKEFQGTPYRVFIEQFELEDARSKPRGG